VGVFHPRGWVLRGVRWGDFALDGKVGADFLGADFLLLGSFWDF